MRSQCLIDHWIDQIIDSLLIALFPVGLHDLGHRLGFRLSSALGKLQDSGFVKFKECQVVIRLG